MRRRCALLLLLAAAGCGAIRATQTSGPCEPPCEPARSGEVERPLPRPADDACPDPDDCFVSEGDGSNR
jgi:hypothetical protein